MFGSPSGLRFEAASSLFYDRRFQPLPRLVRLGREKELDRGAAKAFGQKSADIILPTRLSHDRDLGNLLVVLIHECQIAPAALALPALKILEKQQRADPAVAFNRPKRSILQLAHLIFAELAAYLRGHDGSGSVDDRKRHLHPHNRPS